MFRLWAFFCCPKLNNDACSAPSDLFFHALIVVVSMLDMLFILDCVSCAGKVESQLEGTRNYLIRWANGKSQVQEVVHMYGHLTRKRPLRIGDYVLGLADQRECHI